jgi:TonB family protein
MTHKTLLPRWPVVVLGLIAGGHAPAEEAGYRDIPSSQPERTPAVTAFPEYPDEAQRYRVEGETTVCFDVDSRGRVVRPNVNSSTYEIFEPPAIKAIRASTFAPIPKDLIRSGSEMCRVYLFDPDAIHAAGQVTEPRIPSAASAASIAGSASPLFAMAAALLPQGGTDVAPASAEPDAALADEKTVPLYERGDATVCRTMQRPGSRIAERVCYTRQEEQAAQEASRRMVADLEREQHWRDQAIQEAAMKNRYPGVPGMSGR